MEPEPKPARWMTLLAFAIIYVVWGSTYLAIRIGVHEFPPLLMASLRFFVAGLILYGWMLARGERSPTKREWTSILLVALLIFVIDYGLVFWAEQRVPSGITAVIMATIPVFMTLLEIIFLRTQKLTARLTLALLIGMAGVAVLMSPALGSLAGAPIDRTGAIAIIIGSMSWAVASILMRKLPLPSSKVMSSGAQMLSGGIMLALASAAFGEFHTFHPSTISTAAWASLVYLITFGSIIGFTAYLWLIHHESPTRVGTYAYVNPVVAVLVGYFIAGEPLGLRTILGTLFILISVIVITTTRARQPIPAEDTH